MPVQPVPSSEESNKVEPQTTQLSRSMQEFYQLRQTLLVTTLILTGLLLIPVWWVYGLNIALNYLLGAITGLVYLSLLSRNVERLGIETTQVGKSQLAIFIGVFVVTTQLDSLQVLPVFLGFLTYKAAVIVFTLRTALMSQSSLFESD